MDSAHADPMAALAGAAVSLTLRRYEQALAEAVTDAFLLRHPDWVTRYGERARAAGIEDARFHVQFLAAAIERGSPEAFGDYVQWATRVLGSRRIEPRFLWENLHQIQDETTPLLTELEHGVVAKFIDFAKRCDVAAPAMPTDGPLALTRRLFVQAIVTGERKAALNIARETLRQGVRVQDLYADVFQDGLYEVGRLWETNTITVAQEHMATAVTRYVMAHVFGSIESVSPNRGIAIMTGVPGELHHVGALMVSDMLEAEGWQMQFLGSDLPIPSILATITDTRPQLLGISVTMPFNLHHAGRLIAEAKRVAPGVRVVVGGAAFKFDGWRSTGADDYAADVRSAIALLCSERVA